ncbi:MAG: hypothetical protein B6D56_02945 [Candidatus Omnitrophica bacterium 4484_70.1]|nr:MAG: hypothetical protein B6D56_02945 [Candidatus Omnitrophica bacterium 4484_70.1]
MRNKIILFIFLFIVTFFYLHLKVSLNVERYKLTSSYRLYNKLIDKRDALLYNLTQRTNLKIINQWAENNRFVMPSQKNLIVFNREEKPEEIRSVKSYRTFHLFEGGEVFAQGR